ncbi:MAG: serine/threonine-protein kinase, partial [Polyangiales bacterium]
MAQFTGQANKRSSRRRGLPGEQGAQAAEEPAGPATGYLVDGKYRIDGLLGQGGMGAVYRATHMVSGKRVALKWMLPAAGTTEELAERFVREARATARIDHPNVVDVYDVGTQDGSVYLVMELLHGESLAERLERGPMETVEAVGLLMHALRAVAAAHAQGVIHRDLKPDNIFLCQGPDGEPREPKVLDFGISKVAASSDMRDMSLTQSGTVMGTPFYMSPEQVRGLREVDERGDVYAFGVILYEMLSGAFPFDAETYNELILKIVTEEPTPLLSQCKDLDPILASVIARAMARDREQRHPDIATLAADLEPFAGGVSFRRSTTLPGAPAVSQPVPRGT